MIVFATSHKPRIEYKLQMKCTEKGASFAKIESISEALCQRDLCKNQTSGVWLVNRSFGRGFDLKLAADSTVMIIDPERDVTLTEASQMVGRSSRSLGIGKGFIWLIGGT